MGGGVKWVGRIDREKFAGVVGRIVTDEVVLTEERAAHIRERRGAGFLEKYGPFFAEAVENPDYIFRDNWPNTAIVSKRMALDGRHINIVLRLAVEEDLDGRTNSIITAITEGKKSFARRLRKYEALYKAVDRFE